MQTDTTNELLCNQICDLMARINTFERRTGSIFILEEMLHLLIRHCTSSSGSTFCLVSRFYIYKDNVVISDMPAKYEKTLASIWLKEIADADITIQNINYTMCLHPDQVCDGKPLPLLVVKNSSGIPLTIKERRQTRTHSHLLKNDPQFPGLVFDSALVSAWQSNANFVDATDTIILPNHALLEQLCSLWLKRPCPKPSLATLNVDPHNLMMFVSSLAVHTDARCHFTLSGQNTLYAYLVATANDGNQTDIGRLAIGTTSI